MQHGVQQEKLHVRLVCVHTIKDYLCKNISAHDSLVQYFQVIRITQK